MCVCVCVCVCYSGPSLCRVRLNNKGRNVWSQISRFRLGLCPRNPLHLVSALPFYTGFNWCVQSPSNIIGIVDLLNFKPHSNILSSNIT